MRSRLAFETVLCANLGRRGDVAIPTEIKTDRLVLRPFQADDVEDALAYRDDIEFARFLPHIPQPFTRRDAEALFPRT